MPTIEFTDIEVTPNENAPAEASIKGVGRLDIFLTSQHIDKHQNRGRLNVLVELKIDSPTRAEQSIKYADWITQNHPGDINLLIYLVPNLLSDSKATVGDDRWFCLG